MLPTFQNLPAPSSNEGGDEPRPGSWNTKSRDHKARPRDEDIIKVRTHNFNGAKSTTNCTTETTEDSFKWELAVLQMQQLWIDLLLVQETWMEGTWEKKIHGHQIFHHGPEQQESRRGSGGVAFILSPKAISMWKNAGAHQPDTIAPIDNTERFMGITIKNVKIQNGKTNIHCQHLCTGLKQT